MSRRESESINQGQRDYIQWRARLEADPQYPSIASRTSFEQGLWLQLGEARISSGLTPENVAQRLGVSTGYVRRIERRPYNFSPNTLSRFVQVLGPGYSLEVRVTSPHSEVPIFEGEDRATQVQAYLDKLKADYDKARLELIRTNYPEIYQDGETFINDIYERREAFYQPWEWFGMDERGEAERIQAKYDIGYHRQRPLQEHVSAEADLFLEVSGILFEQKTVESKNKQ